MAKAEAEQEATTSGQADATDTSTTVQDDRNIGDDWDDEGVTLDSIDDDDDIESESEDDSAATDDTDTEDSEDVEEVDESTEETESDEDAAEAEDSDSEDSSDTTDDEADRKAKNDEAAKLRIEARREREAREKLERQREDESIERFLEEAGDDELERQRRENAVKEFKIQEREIGLNRQSLQVGIERAVASIDLFRTGTDLQKEELANALDDFEALHVRKDTQGRPVEVNGDVVAYLQRKAESIRKLAGEGVKSQERKKTKEKARTMAPTRRAPVKAKSDPMADGFDEEASRY